MAAVFDNIVLNEAAVNSLFGHQLAAWDKAGANYKALGQVEFKEFVLTGDGSSEDSSPAVRIQFNPGRIVSSDARIDAQTIRNRQCFFCREGRPSEQKFITYRGEMTDYAVQVNPFPIFPRHLVIASLSHSRQEIDSSRFGDMLSFAKILKNYVIFYNGPRGGASVPDHFHFQGGLKGYLPLEKDFSRYSKEILYRRGFRAGDSGETWGENFVRVSRLTNYTRGAFIIESATKQGAKEAVSRIYYLLSRLTGRGNGKFDPDAVVSSEKNKYDGEGNWEPRMNILCWWVKGNISNGTGDGGFWRIALFARGHLRPSCYYAEGEEHMTISTACVEMAGIIIVPRREDFERINGDDVRKIFDDVSIDKPTEDKLIRSMRTQPDVSVGILHSDEIRFSLDVEYRLASRDGVKALRGKSYIGDNVATLTKDGKILFDGEEYTEFTLEPHMMGTFWLRDVVIGVNFHWERKEDQRFQGKLRFIVDEGKLCAVNLVGVEDYLTSVISSEMSASASEQLLKAHAVISRSWLLAQIEKSEKERVPSVIESYNEAEGCDELIKWYDRDDHNNFDVCADDHCQRYQGLTRQSTKTVEKAIDETWGEVLYNKGEICDARFYKCCGGMLEEFEAAWEPKHYDYLVKVRDSVNKQDSPDLTVEAEAKKWILGNPEAFCNTDDAAILSQVLNNYDQETTHFYRWKEELPQEKAARLVNTKSGFDFGEIVDLVPVERGVSGRLIKLKIVGTKKTLIIGKELEIRRILSDSHLYSSAFVVNRYDADGNPIGEGSDEIPARFELIGAGWGHGVGLCQIGAAVMGEKGYSYDAILSHYYPESELIKKY